MNDIKSDYCDLPRGTHKIEFLPVHMINGWTAGVPSPNITLGRWYRIDGYAGSARFSQGTAATEHGQATDVTAEVLVITDSQETATLLEQLGNMRLVLRITDYAGKQRIVGRPGEYVDLMADDYSPGEILGAQGYRLSFLGRFSKRPMVIT